MSKYKTVNLLDLLDVVGEETAKQILSDFSCPKNSEIETFIRRNALDFAKRKMIHHLSGLRRGEQRVGHVCADAQGH